MDSTAQEFRFFFEAFYRAESRRVLATLIRLLGDFDRAEEALHDACAAALAQWPVEGIPSSPRAWLVSTGRFKAIDRIRREARFAPLDFALESADESMPQAGDEGIADDRLRLIFTCCHPALGADAQVALTLREVCGLSTEEIARAFLTRAPTMAQRIVRAKAKIRDARIPYAVPERAELGVRLEGVLRVIYLVFNEGYSASSGSTLTRVELSAEALRLGRLLHALLPETEVLGLLALMLLQDSRRAARSTVDGELVPLEEQDRTRWDHAQIAEGLAMAARVAEAGSHGPYSLQALIAAEHARADSAGATDWARIAAHYDALLALQPSPVIELNRAVAIAMRDGPQAGLVLVEGLLARGELTNYHLAHAARADLCRRLGRNADARSAYQRAIALAGQEPERRFLERQLQRLPG